MVDVEEVKKRLDIVAVISDYLTLKKAGISYKAVCPFHSEKTASFTVSGERQSWRCFGCGEGGDVISFVQKIDNLSFNEALERLAVRAGVELIPKDPKEIKIRGEKSKIIEVLELATRLYHELLLHHPSAEKARQYLIKRGLDNETLIQFQVGYAPDAWETISRALTKKNIETKWGEAAGMTIKRSGKDSYYDRFRDRVLFPIDNVLGQTIGFTGRTLSDAKDQPKYINTAESLVFIKGEALYALSKAKQSIRSQDAVVMVEGQMDVITAHQFGFTNTVATSGTAVTKQHLSLIKRYTQNIIFAFDADTAGIKALRQAAILSWEVGLNPLAITIPYGKDPDECIRHDKELWSSAVKNAVPVINFFIEYSVKQYDEKRISATDKRRISDDIFSLIIKNNSAVEQDEYLRLLADALNVSDQSVTHDLKLFQQNRGNSESRSSLVIDIRPAKTDDLDLERKVIGLILAYFEHTPPLPEIKFENQALAGLYSSIRKVKDANGKPDDVIKNLPEAWQKRVNAIILETLRSHAELDTGHISLEIAECIEKIMHRDRDDRVHSNAKAIASALASGNKEEAKRLLKSLENDMVQIGKDQN